MVEQTSESFQYGLVLTIGFIGWFIYSIDMHVKSKRIVEQIQEIDNLKDQVKHFSILRDKERKGRINLQQKQREQSNISNKQDGRYYSPIGCVESPFPDRRATPRQPLLVPAAKGKVRFYKSRIQFEHFEELQQFSHIWVIFVFHENTNSDKFVDVNSTSTAKIKPPRLHGNKVGVLSTRSPHRPNNIGLSVCEVLSIGQDFIELSGIDMVNGTPVLDVKPYIPYDVISSEYLLPMATDRLGNPLQVTKLKVPEWIVDSDITMLPVAVTIEVLRTINHAFQIQKTIYLRSVTETILLLSQTLRQDIRGVHQGRGKLIDDTTIQLSDTTSKDIPDTATSLLIDAMRHEVGQFLSIIDDQDETLIAKLQQFEPFSFRIDIFTFYFITTKEFGIVITKAMH